MRLRRRSANRPQRENAVVEMETAVGGDDQQPNKLTTHKHSTFSREQHLQIVQHKYKWPIAPVAGCQVSAKCEVGVESEGKRSV